MQRENLIKNHTDLLDYQCMHVYACLQAYGVIVTGL